MRSKFKTRGFVLLLVLLGLLGGGSPSGSAGVATIEDAVGRAFPGAAVEKKTVFLTDEQAKRIESLARTPLPSRLSVIYVARKGKEIAGYALSETHVVRTKGETVAVFLDFNGAVQWVEILAFHEPPEYRMGERWLSQLSGRVLSDDLWPRRGIQAVSGATLSVQAVTGSVRRLLAIWQVAGRE